MHLIEEIIHDLKPYAFGGMGSLNDLCFCKENGHYIEDEDTANEIFSISRKKLQENLR